MSNILLFPLHRRAGGIRRLAEIMPGQDSPRRDEFVSHVLEALARQLAASGLEPADIEREAAAFVQQVEREAAMVRPKPMSPDLPSRTTRRLVMQAVALTG